MAVAVGGLAIRVAYVWFIRRHTVYGGDPLYFHQGANLLATGHGFINPYAFARHRVGAGGRPPAALPRLPGRVLGGRASAPSPSTCWPRPCSGRRRSSWPAWPGARSPASGSGSSAALLVAVYPNAWRYDGMLLSESMVILVVLIAVWLAYRYWHRPSRWRMAAVGAAVGFAALSRSELVLLAADARRPAGPADPRAAGRRRARRLAVGLGATVLVLAPWIGFNLARFDHTVLLSREHRGHPGHVELRPGVLRDPSSGTGTTPAGRPSSTSTTSARTPSTARPTVTSSTGRSPT